MTFRKDVALPEPSEFDGSAADTLRIKMYCPNHLRVAWNGHIVLGIAQTLFDEGVDIEVWVRSADADARRPYVRQGLPGISHKVLYKLRQVRLMDRLSELRFLGSLRKGDIAYFWPSAPLHLFQQVKDRGHMIAMETINTSGPNCQRILTDAYLRLGVHRESPISEKGLEVENAKLRLADGVLTASPLMTQSYIESGVPEDRVFEGFYGWEPDRFRGTGRALPPADGLTVLFVGSPIVRKGVHLLLQAWDRAGIRGRLVLVGGQPEPIIAERFPQYFDRPDIQWVSWSQDIGDYFRSADVFAFPSLEEGSPLVIYEAMGCGLPAVVSPMGAGAIAWDREGSIILDPYDLEAWADTFRRLDSDPDHRRELGEQARRAALRYTWKEAGLKRLSQFMTIARSTRPHAAASRG